MARQKATARKVLPQVGKRGSPKETQETPLTRIRKELQALLVQDFSFNGVFAFSKRFPLSEPDAPPNPCLRAWPPGETSVGSVGIPLSSRDAEAFPISEEGDCRVSARDVAFGNPAWDTWMQETVMELVSEKLGLSGSATLVLEELVLYTRDYGDDEEFDNTLFIKEPIGTVFVVLPCPFKGAAFEISHDGRKETFEVAEGSGTSTSIVACYAGTTVSFGPAGSGHRLVLRYNISPLRGSRPSTLPDMAAPAAKLNEVLHAWKAIVDTGSCAEPTYIACVLRNKYKTNAGLGSQLLSGADALLLRYLAPLATKIGFMLHLARVEGRLDVPCSAPWYDPRTREYDDDDVTEEDFVEDDDHDAEGTLTVKEVVDLDGRPVEIDDLKLVVHDAPKDAAHRAAYICGPIVDRNEDPDSDVFKRYERDAATRAKVWKRTVLLISPLGDGMRPIRATRAKTKRV